MYENIRVPPPPPPPLGIQRSRYNFIFWRFFITFKYDFHVDAERIIVRTREMSRDILQRDYRSTS